VASPQPPARPRRTLPRIAAAVLLLAALASFGMGMVTITFDQSLISELQQVNHPLPAACLQGGIATYSGMTMTVDAPPSIDTGCFPFLGAAASDARVGVQPLAVAGALAVLAALAANLWWRRGALIAASLLPLLAAALLLVNAWLFPSAFRSRFHLQAATVVGVPATGLLVALGLLVAAPLVHAVAAGAGWAARALAPIEAPSRAPDR
jgi:hypothetical protein